MIEVEKLTERYRPVTVVDSLTFTARLGHVTGFRAGDWPDSCRPQPRRLTVLGPAAAAPTVARP